jgi:predicted DNA-binding transcriptional regulator AlpA
MNAAFRTPPRHQPDTSQVDTVCGSMSTQSEIPSQKAGRVCPPTADHSGVPNSRLIKKKELAARLSISPRTVDDLVAKRTIPYLAISPRLHLFDLEAVQAALAKRFEVRAKGVLL